MMPVVLVRVIIISSSVGTSSGSANRRAYRMIRQTGFEVICRFRRLVLEKGRQFFPSRWKILSAVAGGMEQ